MWREKEREKEREREIYVKQGGCTDCSEGQRSNRGILFSSLKFGQL